jgi:hypothetical protein
MGVTRVGIRQCSLNSEPYAGGLSKRKVTTSHHRSAANETAKTAENTGLGIQQETDMTNYREMLLNSFPNLRAPTPTKPPAYGDVVNRKPEQPAPRYTGPKPRPPHPQLTASAALPKVWVPSDLGRERKMQALFDAFIPVDARQSDLIERKLWLRDVMPDAQVVRLFKAAWNDPVSPLYGQGFVTFFRTDRDTLGLIFEDVRGYRHIWVLDMKSRTPRRIGSVA